MSSAGSSSPPPSPPRKKSRSSPTASTGGAPAGGMASTGGGGGAPAGTALAGTSAPPAGARLVAWQEELLAAVLGVDVYCSRQPTSAAAAPLIRPWPAPDAALFGSPTALTDAGSQLLDTVIFAVLPLPPAARGGLSPLGWLLASYRRLETVEEDVPSLVDVRLRQAFGAGQAGLASSRAALASALGAIRTHLVSYTCTAVTSPETFVSDDGDSGMQGASSSSAAAAAATVMMSGAGTTGHAELLAFLAPPSAAGGPPPPLTFLEALLAHARSEGGDCVRDVFAPLFREAAARLAARSPPSENPFAGEEGPDDDEDEDGGGGGGAGGQQNPQEAVRVLARSIMRETRLPIASMPPPWVAEALGGGGGGSGAGSSSASAAKSAAAAKKAALPPPPSLLRPDSFIPLLSLLSQLTRQSDLVKALVADPAYGWGADVVAAAQAAGAAAAAGTASGPPPAGATGRDVEKRTFLGQLLSLGPQEDDYRGGGGGGDAAALNPSADLLTGWLNTTRKGDGSDGWHQPRGVGDEDTDAGVARDNAAVLALLGPAGAQAGLARMLPPVAGSPAELDDARRRYTAALESTQTALRNGGAGFMTYACAIVDNIVKKGGKDAVFNWVGGLYNANAARSMSAYEWASPSPAIEGLSSSALLFNASRAMLALCEPFLADPCSPKTARIDLRYVSNTVPNGSGGGRFHMRRGEERLAPFIDYSEGAAGSGSGGADAGSTQPSWIDARNYARQHQFRERHKAMVAAALGGSKGSGADVTDGGGAGAPAPSPFEDVYAPLGSAHSSAPLAWHPITEMFWLAVRGLGLADSALRARDGRLRESLASLRAQRFKLAAALRRVPRGGVLPSAAAAGGAGASEQLHPQAVLTQHTAQYVRTTRVGRRAVAAMHAAHALVNNAHRDALSAPLRLYRLLAVVLTRAVVPTSARYVGGAVDDAWHILGGPAAKEGGGGAAAAAAPKPSAASGGGTGLTPSLGGMALAPRPVSPVNVGDAAASSSAAAAPPALVPPPLGPPPTSIPPITTVALPLLPPSAVVCGLPEHLLHDMASWARSLGTANAPYQVLVSGELPRAGLADLLTAFLAFLGSPLHVHNPYARGEIVGALTVFAPFRHDALRKPGGERLGLPPFFTLLPDHPLAVASLAPSLTAFHVDIEYSGSHTVFYDKFQHRTNTTSLLEWLWTRWPAHRATLEAYATSPATAGRFIKFANAVTADVGYHMEEALKALSEVREIQHERADAAQWGALDDEMRRDKEQKLLNAEHNARASLHSASEQLGLLATLAATPGGAGSVSSAGASKLGAAWLCPDIRDRVAQGLGYYLDSLVGEAQRRKLRVDNADALNWRPRDVLLALVTIYNNLAAVPPGEILVAAAASSGGGGGGGGGGAGSGSGADAYAAADAVGAAAAGGDADPWAAAIVRDGRSFHPENFKLAQEVLLHNAVFVQEHMNVPAEVERLRGLHARVLAAASATAADEEVLGDVPDVLTDPLLGELMRDPVLLPTSRNIVDRSTAKRMLLDEERDPFNREYLTLEMLKPLPELAAALGDWVAAKKRGDAAAADAAVRWAGALVEAAGDPVAARAALAGGGSSSSSSSSAAAAPAPAPAPVPAPAPAPAPAQRVPASGSGGDGVGDDDDDMDEELRAALALSSGEAAAGAGGAGGDAPSGAGGSASDDEIDNDLAAALALSMREAAGEQGDV